MNIALKKIDESVKEMFNKNGIPFQREEGEHEIIFLSKERFLEISVIVKKELPKLKIIK